jgi:OPT family oligopeptide transporter
MSLSNLYIALKTGWSVGVTITASILAFAVFTFFEKIGLVRRGFGLYENNAAKSVASAAGYMTGGGTVAAIPAVMMLTGTVMPWWQMLPWVATIALLGVITAIPMKRQMINVDQLRFPTGIACAETLRSLYASGKEGLDKARALGLAGLAGAFVAWIRGAKAAWMPWNLPEKLALPFTVGGRPAVDYTFAFDTSVIMIGAGALMGMRVAWSQLLGAAINFGILAPIFYGEGAIAKLGYAGIVKWSVWFGSALLLTSGLLSFAFSWRTVARAFGSMGSAMKGTDQQDPAEAVEAPMKWFLIGIGLLGPVAIFLEWYFFGIKWYLGILSVLLSFFIAVVACRATGETDTTPTGALGKVTQLTFGALDPGNVTTNLMTANVTGGIGLHSADLLTDLKTGYLIGASPRQQFAAQLLGVIAGSLFVVPAFLLIVPTASAIGTDQLPAPGAQTWAAVAQLLAQGWSSLHPSARWSLFIGGGVGIVLPLLERKFPKAKPYIPSSMGLGLAFTMPAWNSLSMFVGAALAWLLAKKRPALADRFVVPVSSGLIAGESLMGIALAALVLFGVLS